MTEQELVKKIRKAFPSPYKIGEAYPLTITGENEERWEIAARIDQWRRNARPVIHFYYPTMGEYTLSRYTINRKNEMSYHGEADTTPPEHYAWHKSATEAAAKAAKDAAEARANPPAKKRLVF